MRALFAGEPDNGYNCTAHNAQALAALGVETKHDQPHGWRSPEWRQTCERTDILHLITYGQLNWVLLRKLWWARMHGVQIVRYWVGTDSLWARFHRPSLRFAQALDLLGAVNVAVADHLVDELADVGIVAQRVPIITPGISSAAQPHPLPKQFTALCYLPTRKREFYGGPIIDRLIAELPDVRFIVLCDDWTDYSGRSNVESLGYVEDTARTVGRSTVLVRPTMHDGMPRLALEMLSHGRHAITSQSIPHCANARTYDEFAAELQRLKSSASFNLSGREYVCGQFETRKAAAVLHERMNRCLTDSRSARRRRGRKQATWALSRCPWMLSRKCEPPPQADNLPADAEALRALLRGAEETEATEPVGAPGVTV